MRKKEPISRKSSLAGTLEASTHYEDCCVCSHAGDLLLVLCLTMATSVLSASFAVFLVRERECHSKGVQMVAGASPSAFWSAAYFWDLLNFSIPTLGEPLP